MKQIALLLVVLLLIPPAHGAEPDSSAVPILLYHRMGPAVTDAMTVRTSVFASHLKYLQANGYTVIPLRRLTTYLAGNTPAPSARAVVITADDGHESVYTGMFPLLRRYRIPVTLFIYPSAISNAKYALTWQQLREMQDSGLVNIQSHTYMHHNFKQDKKRLAPETYARFVDMQLAKSKQVLEQRLGKQVDMLAWPFGIYDDALIDKARQLGYVAGFTLVRRHANRSDNPMALPRYLMTDPVQGVAFGKLLAEPSHTDTRSKP
jgi:peptidoglycan/xylan/chitin deacetylase (PgdA/CDA1 family)